MKKEFDDRLYRYALSIVKLADSFSKESSAQTIARQLVRSGTSVTANVREAKGASSRKEYINFYHYALKSSNETDMWISLAIDAKKNNKPNSKRNFGRDKRNSEDFGGKHYYNEKE